MHKCFLMNRRKNRFHCLRLCSIKTLSFDLGSRKKGLQGVPLFSGQSVLLYLSAYCPNKGSTPCNSLKEGKGDCSNANEPNGKRWKGNQLPMMSDSRQPEILAPNALRSRSQ